MHKCASYFLKLTCDSNEYVLFYVAGLAFIYQDTWGPSHEDLRCHNSQVVKFLPPRKMHILCVGSKFCVNFQRTHCGLVTSRISVKIRSGNGLVP